jgi:hypothetical protein
VNAVIRPDGWDFPLLLHVLGAMLLVGALILAAASLLLAGRGGTPSLVRLGYRALLLGVLPAWVLMRAGGEWIASKEGLTDSSASWVQMGFTMADSGLMAIVVATVLAGLAARRATGPRASSGPRLVSGALASLLLVTYLVAVWAMTTKPG